jgi:hypothetical protein
MPTGKNPDVISLGPGTLLIAPIGTPEPATRAAAWDDAWIEMGYTADGSEFSSTLTTDKVEVAEELYPLRYVTTQCESAIKFALAQITVDNLVAAFNGGTVVVGLADVTFEPPALGTEVRVMIGWDSQDGEERWVFRRCLNTGNVMMARKKGAAKTEIPVEFKLEKPTGAEPFKTMLALHRQHNAA